MKRYLTFLLLISFSISSSSEEAYADLDARIIYEVAKGSDAKLENVLQIEQELIASSGDKSNPSLLSRTLTLKHSILTLKAGNETTNIQSASSVGTGGFDRSEADTDGPTLNSISVNQTTVDVTDGPQSLNFMEREMRVDNIVKNRYHEKSTLKSY